MADFYSKHPELLNLDWASLFKADRVILGQLVRDAALVAHEPHRFGRKISTDGELVDLLLEMPKLGLERAQLENRTRPIEAGF